MWKSRIKRFVVLLLPVLVLIGFTTLEQGQEPAEETGMLLYFLAEEDDNGGGDAITGLYVDISRDLPKEEQAAAVMHQLIAGAPGVKSPLPAGTQLRSVSVSGRRAYVDLTAGYSMLRGIDLTLASYCITLSLTDIEDISTVSITANGRSSPFATKDVWTRNDVLLTDTEDVIEKLTVKLYFMDLETGELVPEERMLSLYEGDPLAELLLESLLAGPTQKGLVPVIPPEFTVNSARVENRTCYVSLPQSAIDALPDDLETQALILDSIASTLYGMDTVEELRIMVEGKEVTTFGDVPLSDVAFRPQPER